MMVKAFNQRVFLLLFIVCLVAVFINPNTSQAATDLADGTYTINYTVLHAENDSASMANDYWEKPAKIIVKDGTMQMQMTINHSSWVTEFKVPAGGGYRDVDVISTDSGADKRVVQFPIEDLSKPLASKIHVTVKDIDYDHDYTIRFSFDTNSIKPVGTVKPATNNSSEAPEKNNEAKDSNESTKTTASTENETKTETANTIENPQTGDTAMISLVIFIFALSGAYLVWKLKATSFR